MNKIQDFECKKSFSSTAQTGIAFHWLKCTFGDGLESAVREAIRVVYFPSAVAFSAGTDRNKAIAALKQSRMTFDRWMNFAQGVKSVAKQSPKRVLIEFALSVDDSDCGVVLDWLLNHQDNVEKKILDAVLWLYLPVALCALGDPDGRLAILRSQTIFSRWMDLPGYLSPLDDILPFGSALYLASPQEAAIAFQQLKETLPVEDMPSENIANSEDIANSKTPEKPEEPEVLDEPGEPEKPDDVPELNLDYDF
jgi:hypothetical protein